MEDELLMTSQYDAVKCCQKNGMQRERERERERREIRTECAA